MFFESMTINPMYLMVSFGSFEVGSCYCSGDLHSMMIERPKAPAFPFDRPHRLLRRKPRHGKKEAYLYLPARYR